MKIGIIGNMNNAYFSIARYLRDEGYDCDLLILANEPSHFDPACDTFSLNHNTYCKHVNWGNAAKFLKEDFEVVKKDLEAYNFLIGSGPAPAYAAKTGRKLDLFIPYGFDIYGLPFLPLVHPRHLLAFAAVRRYQRKGIKESTYILFDRTNKSFERIIKKLNYSGKRIISPPPMVYYKEYESNETNGTNPLLSEIIQLRQNTDFLLIQHTRQLWKRSFDYWSFKGNNFLIQGLAALIKNYPALKIKLVLFEYGDDVEETKKLIKKLQLQHYIHWVPKMRRNELMSILALADLIIGELRYSWLTYGVALEALFLAKPFMHNRIDEEFSKDYPELYPMLHAFSAQSVYNGLEKLIKEKNAVQNMGEGGRKWFFTYCVHRPISLIKSIINEKAAIL